MVPIRNKNIFITYPISTPNVFISIAFITYLLYLVYEERPPLGGNLFWTERCVAWKKTKKDCDRCCAAYGTNRWVPSAIAKVLLLLHFLRRTYTAVHSFVHCNGILKECIRLVLVIGLTLPLIWLLPEHSKWVPCIEDVVGLCSFVVGFISCCIFKIGSRRRAISEMCCWCGAASFVLSKTPIQYHTLDVKTSNHNKDAYVYVTKYVPLVLSLITLLVVLVPATSTTIKSTTTTQKNTKNKDTKIE